ncbi:MAG TPA: PEP-CTERM sorting domain-containing protein [Pirellulaceae bacterium]|nr:PEP-CTERM sorting domain-containing protein [Pirellulaceae bacterium]
MSCLKYFFVALLASLGGLTLSSTADAGLQVTLTAGASSTTIIDGGAGDADGLANNEIQVNSVTVGGYEFKVTLVATNSPGGGGIAFLDSGTNQIIDVGGGATTVSIFASANGFTDPSSPPDVYVFSGSTAQFNSATPNGNTADFSYNAYIDSTNGLSTSAAGDLVGTGSDSVSAPGNASVGETQVYTIAGTPYAINLALIATFNEAGSSLDLDGTVKLSPVPEPATLAIWGLGAMGVLVAGRFRRKMA